MTWKRFARVLVRKSERALKIASLALNAGDYDSAVNRAYYAMFDVARAALLCAGVAEDRLPRTHNGVIEAFRQHAVQSGLMERQLAGELNRTESLRIKADYTDLEMEPKTATEVVENAELFVQGVVHAFGLDEISLGTKYENDNPNHDDKVSETVAVSKIERKDPHLQSFSLEEERRQARENWLQLQRQKIEGARNIGHERDTGRRAKEELSHSPDNDLDE
ncbi:MAG: HEPN domain-containing protein [Steroidobacteraceae bacterium]